MTSNVLTRVLRKPAAKPESNVNVAAEKKNLFALLQGIADNDVVIKKAQEQDKQLRAELFEAMKAQKNYSLALQNGAAMAQIVELVGNASNKIVPSLFQKLVSEEDFFSCVTVGIEKAKKVLSEVELTRIMVRTPGEKKPETLEVIFPKK